MYKTEKDFKDNSPEEIPLDEFIEPLIPISETLYPTFYECDREYSYFEHDLDYSEASSDSSGDSSDN
jgi:hypothetical protein